MELDVKHVYENKSLINTAIMSHYALQSLKHRQNMNSKTKLQLSATVFSKSRLMYFYMPDLLSRFSLAPTLLSLLDLKVRRKKKGKFNTHDF
jgi:hypothetical protein